MTKKELIERFIKARQEASPAMLNSIGLSVRNQFMRDVWELCDDNGKTQIRGGNNPSIRRWNTIIYCENSGKNGFYEFKIAQDEYKELEKVYFGYFEPDYVYLRRIKSI